jgi:hypothetical protein
MRPFVFSIAAVLLLDLSLNFTPPPPPDRGAPGDRGEGASRGDCAASNHPLTALVPSYEQTLNSAGESIALTQVWGLTTAERPSFWFYLPYDRQWIQEIEFVLQTEQNQNLDRIPISIPATAGIIRVQIPPTASPLQPGIPYRWFFKVRVACNPAQPPTLSYVEGWVERVELDEAWNDRLRQASLLQRAELYAEQGIWYDALTTLAELHRDRPDDAAIAADWTALLRSIGLEHLATQPLLE